MIIGTAGHIDHGKTSLVRALTGIDTDRLPEEKSRGITLDLGFAYVPLVDGGVLGFVDVPGHERLVHTMIAGAASIDMALLVVAADDGVMPQTREHLQILSLLGIPRGVVALTKVDMVDARRAREVEADIAILLDNTPLRGADVFPVSTLTGVGIEALRARLLDEAARANPTLNPEQCAFRLSVDRSFSLAGVGTVVTGSVVAGSVQTANSVLVLPSGLRARVRGIHAANRVVTHARQGERCALNLTGQGLHKDSLRRGDWVVAPDGASQAHRSDIALRLLASERSALKQSNFVLAHHGAAQLPARLILLEPTILRPGESGFAHLVLDRPAPMRHGDRLILRDSSASRTIAGGRVLDPRPPERHRRSPARLAALNALHANDTQQALRAWLAQPPYLYPHAELRADWGLTEAGLRAVLPDSIMLGAYIALQEPIEALTEQITTTLAAFHAGQPAAPGMAEEALRASLPAKLPRAALAALLDHLTAANIIAREGQLLRLPTHRGSLAGEDGRLWETLRPFLAEQPHRPPLLREIALAIAMHDVPLRRACKGFARLGLVMELAPDRFFLREAVLEMARAAHALSASQPDGTFTAAQFRDRLGNGRQLAIQVLDDFDRRGITIRRGDLRRAGKNPDAVFNTQPAG